MRTGVQIGELKVRSRGNRNRFLMEEIVHLSGNKSSENSACLLVYAVYKISSIHRRDSVWMSLLTSSYVARIIHDHCARLLCGSQVRTLQQLPQVPATDVPLFTGTRKHPGQCARFYHRCVWYHCSRGPAPFAEDEHGAWKLILFQPYYIFLYVYIYIYIHVCVCVCLKYELYN